MTKTKQIAYLVARLTELVKIEKSGKVNNNLLSPDTHILLNSKISEIINTLDVFYDIDASGLVNMSLEDEDSK